MVEHLAAPAAPISERVEVVRRGDGTRLQAGRNADVHARRDGFLRQLRATPGDGRLLGRSANREGDFQWCGLPLPARSAWMHLGISGATGTGKSFMVASTLQLVSAGVPVILTDMKSELADLMLEVVIPAVVARGQRGLDRPRPCRSSLRRWSRALLRLTEPEPRVSRQIQSMNIAGAERVRGRGLGVRMLRAMLPMAGLVVERNLPLPVLADWLRSPETFAQRPRHRHGPDRSLVRAP